MAKKTEAARTPQRELLETRAWDSTPGMVVSMDRQKKIRARGVALREARQGLKLFLGDAARAAGMSVVDLCAVELGRRVFSHEEGWALVVERMTSHANHLARQAPGSK